MFVMVQLELSYPLNVDINVVVRYIMYVIVECHHQENANQHHPQLKNFEAKD
jgi:hypothetical protein